jgi:amidase
VGYLQTRAWLAAFSRRVAGWWDDHDVLVTPSVNGEPPPLGGLDDGEAVRRFMPYGAQFNVTGQPAISLPLHHSDAGLPIGVQFVGPPAGEEMLLSLAAQLEQARPWAERRPPIAVRA